MGVVVTIVGTTFIQILSDEPEIADEMLKRRRRQNKAILAILVVCDVWGVGFPFVALYDSALGKMSSSLVTGVLVSTIVVTVANLAVPLYVASLFRSLIYFDFSKVTRPKLRVEAVGRTLVGGNYISEDRWVELRSMIESNSFNYDSAIEFLQAFNKFFASRSEGGKFSSLVRRGMYHYNESMIPTYARMLVRGSQLSPIEDNATEGAGNEADLREPSEIESDPQEV